MEAPLSLPQRPSATIFLAGRQEDRGGRREKAEIGLGRDGRMRPIEEIEVMARYYYCDRRHRAGVWNVFHAIVWRSRNRPYPEGEIS